MPITVVLDGRVLPAVTDTVLQGGTILAPSAGVADRMVTQFAVYPGGTLELRNGQHVVRVRADSRRAEIDGRRVLLPVAPQRTAHTMLLPLAAIARALGERISYDVATRTVWVQTFAVPQVLPMTPVPPRWPTMTPTVVFTPQPPKTPTPKVTPPAHPRRTPIPVLMPVSFP